MLIGVTNRAMHLDRLARDMQCGIGRSGFAGRRRKRALAGVVRRIERTNRAVERCAREFDLNEEIDRAMLERLKRADRLAELFSRAQIIERPGLRLAHQSEHFGRGRDTGLFQRSVQRALAPVRCRDTIGRAHRNIVEPQRSAEGSIGPGSQIERHARCVTRDVEQADAAGLARGDDETVGPRRAG